jgi:hypothetical protein
MLKAGVARNLITPQVGLHTYGFSAREGVASEVESDLVATALVLRDEATCIAIVALDLCFLPLDVATRLRRDVAARIGTDPESILINTSHTHSAPAPPDWSPEFSDQNELLTEYQTFMFRQVIDAVGRAHDSMGGARVVAAEGSVNLGVQRREAGPDGCTFLGEVPDGPTDAAVSVIRVDRLDGSPLAILCSYGCHPVVVGPQSFVVSADYPSSTRNVVEQTLGGMTLFLQGGGGDVMPRDGMGYESDCSEERVRVGAVLGGEVVKVASTLRSHRTRGVRKSLPSLLGDGMTLRPLEPAPLGEVRLGAICRELSLPLVELPTRATVRRIRGQCEADLAAARTSGSPRQISIALHFARWCDVLAEAVRNEVRSVPCIVQAIRIGNIGIVGISAEVFSASTRSIREQSPFASTMALGYTNGVLCYLPPTAAYPSGGWSPIERYRIPDMVFQSYLVPVALRSDSEQIVVEACVDMLGELRRASESSAPDGRPECS